MLRDQLDKKVRKYRVHVSKVNSRQQKKDMANAKRLWRILKRVFKKRLSKDNSVIIHLGDFDNGYFFYTSNDNEPSYFVYESALSLKPIHRLKETRECLLQLAIADGIEVTKINEPTRVFPKRACISGDYTMCYNLYALTYKPPAKL